MTMLAMKPMRKSRRHPTSVHPRFDTGVKIWLSSTRSQQLVPLDPSPSAFLLQMQPMAEVRRGETKVLRRRDCVTRAGFGGGRGASGCQSAARCAVKSGFTRAIGWRIINAFFSRCPNQAPPRAGKTNMIRYDINQWSEGASLLDGFGRRGRCRPLAPFVNHVQKV